MRSPIVFSDTHCLGWLGCNIIKHYLNLKEVSSLVNLTWVQLASVYAS